MPNTTPNRPIVLAFAPVAALAAVVGIVILLGEAGGRASPPHGGLPTLASAPLGARAEAACGRRDWAVCENLSRAALRTDPSDAVSWLRLARVDAGRHGDGLTAAGTAALAHSYDVSPLGYEAMEARFAFSVRHWSTLTDALRDQIRGQLRAGWIVGGPPYGRMRDLCYTPVDPAGRKAVCGMIAGVQAEPLQHPELARQGLQKQ